MATDIERDDNRPGYIALVTLIVSMAATGGFFTAGWTMAGLLAAVVVISIIIAQACEPFADSAQWIGKKLHLPGSVRGAVLDAVASSLPELFISIFFVMVAVINAEPDQIAREVGVGYGASLATCVGSAVYNMILIPAICALVISFARPGRPTIDVGREVISRDGLWYLGSQAVLIVFLFQKVVYWWVAVLFFGIYAAYVLQLYLHAKWHRRVHRSIRRHLGEDVDHHEAETIARELRSQRVRKTTDTSVGEYIEARSETVTSIESAESPPPELSPPDADPPAPEFAGVFFDIFRIPLGHVSAWTLIVLSTAVAATACYWLVEVTNRTAEVLAVPVFFVAVILAAAASSLPDTLLSVAAALRGDDDGAVSNAFGSNTFNICICLSLPLLVNAYVSGWNPVYLTENGAADGKTLSGIVGLYTLLSVLSLITLAIMWHKHQINRAKALLLCGLYGIFLAYAVVGSLGLFAV